MFTSARMAARSSSSNRTNTLTKGSIRTLVELVYGNGNRMSLLAGKVKWPNFGHRLFPVTLQKTHRPGKKGLSLQQPICCLRSGNIPLPPQPD